MINNKLTFNPYQSGWIALSSGFAACFIGLLYPFIDSIGVPIRPVSSSNNSRRDQIEISRNSWDDDKLGGKQADKKSWIKTGRCLGCFLALLYALSKLNTSSKTSWLIILTLSIAMWYEFDKTNSGLIISLVVSSCGSICVMSLCSQGFYEYHQLTKGSRQKIS